MTGESLSRFHVESQLDPEIDVRGPERVEIDLPTKRPLFDSRRFAVAMEASTRMVRVEGRKGLLFGFPAFDVEGEGLGQILGEGTGRLFPVFRVFRAWSMNRTA